MVSLTRARSAGALRRVLSVWWSGLFLIVSPVLVGAVELSVAPLNPEFADAIENQDLRLMSGLSAEGQTLSYLPSPLGRPARQAKAVLAATDELPSSFDLRALGGVTPVQDQGSCGSCWAFATYGSLESYLRYCHPSHKSWNFSETDMTQNHGFDWRECAGGNFDMATAYLARWAGPVNSRDLPYLHTSLAVEEAPVATVRKHVQSVWYLPERTDPLDNTQVKTALMTYGAVTAAIHYDGVYYSSGPSAYYYSGSKTTSLNHAVVIVGWDDNYSRSNFAEGQRPPGNGAFIVKNSWGKQWGKDGYFYLSYYDKKLSNMISFHNAPWPGNYQRAYQYDPLGWTSSVGYSSETAWFANVFTAADGAANIEAVSFYTPVAGASYVIYVYRDVIGSDPRNGVLVNTERGTLAKAGYRTIRTYQPPMLPPAVVPGSKFSIVVKLTTPGYFYPIPLEQDIAGYSSGAKASAGQSYVSADGKNWDDLTLISSFERTNVCLKAFGG